MPERSASRGRVLVVEDEAYVRESLGEMLRARGFGVDLAASAEAALAMLGRTPVDVVLTDLKMPGAGGLGLIRGVNTTSPDTPVIVLTGFGTIASAVECVRGGATDYILKPADPDALEVALERAMASRALRREVSYLRSAAGTAPADPAGTDTDIPVGRSAGWLEAMKMVSAAAPTDSTVLILGESGTGKELVARRVHQLSARAKGPFVRVNCAAIPVEMWESEFFGHRRGSFTGASGDREGRFLLAHRGTLFMDEIGAMPIAAQAKILRVLQDGEFDRLGDSQPTRVDVRVIAATNSNLEAEAAAGRFRNDLFYRLNVVRIDLPALRDRPDDIPLLAERFTRQISTRLGRPAPGITSQAVTELTAYAWPGNVRELRNVIERALILNPGETLNLPDLLGSGASASTGPGGGGGDASRDSDADLNIRAALGRREKEVILEALRRSGGVRKEASRLLGIDQRNLGYYLRKHDINPDLVSE
ncbi:MAG TPA: sigma-54 dependent transcriptional regulator [Patescibacteria group bacterium]|nr:sigma-54 dependent transcriptional regulator [Patescibacteria group bacterium]